MSHPAVSAPVDGAIPVPVIPTPNADAPQGFVILSAGDDELAPITTLVTDAGPMLPLFEFASQIGATATDEGDRVSLALRTADPVSASVSASSGRGQRTRQGGSQPLHLRPGDLVRRDGQWYASIDALRAMTSLEMAFDPRSQSVIITSPRAEIPRYAAAVRRAQRQPASPSDAEYGVGLRPAASARVSSSGLLPRSASLTYALSHDNRTGAVSGQGTFGATLLGGGLSVTTALAARGQKQPVPDVTWLGGNPLSRFLTQARVGWGAATGIAPLPGNGISLTNAPFSRAMGLGSLPISGMSAPGDEIEIQSGGRLLGVVTADANGQWTSNVPVGFGQNLLDIAAYGPQGVTRRSVLRSFEGDHLAAGKVEYGVTAQRSKQDAFTCALLSCGDLGNVDLRWGATSRVTLRSGVSLLRARDSASAADHRTRVAPYASVVAAPTGWLQLREDVGGRNWSRTRAIVQPSLALRLDVGHEMFGAGGGEAPFWLSQRATTTRAESFASTTWRPVPGDLGKFWINLIGRNTLGTRTNSQTGSVVLGGRVAGSLVTFGADRAVITPIDVGGSYGRTRLSSGLTVPQLRRGPRWLAASFATFGASLVAQEARSLTINSGLTSTLRGGLMMQVGSDWRPGSAPAIRVQFQRHSRAAIVMQSVTSTGVRNAPLTASTSVLGSVIAPLDGSAPSFTSDLVALRARVRVKAFLDRDANGLADPDEERVPDLGLFVGTQRAVTDASGTAVVDGLPVLDAMMVRSEQLYVNAADGSIWVLSGPSPWARLVPYAETLVRLPFVLSANGTFISEEALPGDLTVWSAMPEQPVVPATAHRFFADGTAPLGPMAPGQYRFELRRDGVETPAAVCVALLQSGQDLRLRFPPGLDAGARCLIDASPPGK
ncbi:MAG: hypothetical protein IT355_06660 [Gemmatimonadaceae bacterium]|nr:hypothetical protein [Gemmatimonadaceae bacterium]